MKIIMALFLVAAAALGAAAVTDETAPIAMRLVKRYYPGDFVHLIVDAPPDTNSITSILPNGDRVEMERDRRTGVWHGLWQVPIGFKAGSYKATLQATDLEENIFTGETSPFLVGELTMITMIRKPATPEAETREQTSRRLSVETAILAEKSEAAPEAEVKPAPPAKKKAATVVRKKTAGKPRQVKWVEARDRRDLNVEKARLMTSARYYMEKMDFDNVRTQLKSLVNIDPKNTAYKKMLRRVETVLKTETEKE